MKAKTLQIVWHCKEPVLALDFHPAKPNLLATGGADRDIKVRPCLGSLTSRVFFFI